MTILSQTLHTFKDGDTHVAAQIDGQTVVLGQTRNEEHASEGRFNLLTTIPLQEAIAMAKAILALQEQEADEDEARFTEWLNREEARRIDYPAIVDAALTHDIRF